MARFTISICTEHPIIRKLKVNCNMQYCYLIDIRQKNPRHLTQFKTYIDTKFKNTLLNNPGYNSLHTRINVLLTNTSA